MRIAITYTGSRFDTLLIERAIEDEKITGIFIFDDGNKPPSDSIVFSPKVTITRQMDYSEIDRDTARRIGDCEAFIW